MHFTAFSVGMERFELSTLAGHGSEPCAYTVPPHALLCSLVPAVPRAGIGPTSAA